VCPACIATLVLNTYNFLDLTPLGRQEEGERIQGWIRHHDKYGASKPPRGERSPGTARTPTGKPASLR
jgi:hypothetical protein